MIQGFERIEPHNHYTTAPLVITRVTRMTSPRRLIPASTIKNTSKNRRYNQTDLITRWSLTNRWTATLFDDRLNLSKTQTLKWWQLLNERELEACKPPGRNPNRLQHGTRANGSTNGDTALWQILDAHLCWWFPSTQKEVQKLYEILVATIYRTSKSDSVCGQGISFGEVRFWNPRWSLSRVGHGLLLGVNILSPPPWLLGLLEVHAGPLHCS
jgi:hypothetical protein